MKTNRYVYIVPFDNYRTIVFNGITKDFCIINNQEISSYVAIMQDPNSYVNSHPLYIKEMKEKGFILKDEIDPKMYLKCHRRSFIEAPIYKAIILPTFECNYNCWYCIQKHTPLKLDERKLRLVVKHNKKYLLDNSIKEYVLSWFGGEPLTQPHVVVGISAEMKRFCHEHGIKYTGAITSNGALLREDVILKLKECGISYYQIAVDGDEEAHNRVKHDALSESSFALVLGNICNLVRINESAYVTLRVNYTIDMLRNKRIVRDVIKYIPENLRKNIIVDLQKVWQVNEELVPFDDLIWIQNEFSRNGFMLETSHIFSMCYVEKKHYNMFYYNGGVEKCDKRTPDTLRGYINEDGDVVWKEKPVFPSYDLFASDCVCSDCDYYPLCFCGCPINREDEIAKNPNKQIVCGFRGDYSLLETRIRDYCWRVYHNAKYNLLPAE